MRYLLVCFFTVSGASEAQDPTSPPSRDADRKLGWSNTADLGFVVTSGNSDTATLTFDDKLVRSWENAELSFRFGALRTRTAEDPFAIGAPDDFLVIEDTTRELDNERYYLAGRYDRDIAQRVYWVTGAGWDRDRDAGIENRSLVYVGLGNRWRDDHQLRFKTDYAITYTRRIDQIEDPTRNQTFSEARLSSDYMQALTASTRFESDFVFFSNLSDASDYRLDTTNAVATNLTSTIALRFGVQFLYQNSPALEEIDLFDRDPASGGIGIGSAVVRKNKLDSILRFALVITF